MTKLLRASPYSPRVTVTDATPAEIVEYGEALKLISRVPQKLGDVVKMSDQSAQLIAYYRNNVLHLFAIPSLVACAFIGNSMLRTEDIQRLAWRVYPYVASELFLRWREEELAGIVAGQADAQLLFDWAGGLVWIALGPCEDAGAGLIRRAVATTGGHATLIRAPAPVRATVAVFEPQEPAVAALTKRIKEGFDPAGILNPGRMWAGV